MASLTLQLDNDLCSTKSDCDTSEQIIKLFPKCRPRSDANLNPIIITSEEHELTDNAVSDSVMSECPERNTDRIIEIAGGREIFSQSRSKAVRKSRNVFSSEDYDKKKDKNKSPIGQGIWEVREISSVRHQKTDKYGNCITSKRASPNQNETVLNNRDIVVFDDIEDSWKDQQIDFVENNKAEANDIDLYESSSIATSPISPISHQQQFSNFFKGMISDLDETPESEVDHKITKVIGNLPIAVYEGSPKRYGVRHSDNASSHPALPSAHSLLASPSVYPPRPGFPQRVICTPTDPDGISDMPIANVDSTTSATTTSTFDYLYEFSETRKVLEEFFKYPSEEEKRYESDFQDLEYELRRQTNGDGSGSSYVGQRLAKCVGVDQGEIYEHESLEHENNFIDLSVGTGSSGDLGETEVGLQVGHSRNFTLSPETTDCDSNCGDLDSEVSLMLMDDLVPSVGLLGSTELGVPADSTRLYSSMPVLEDGLSSGHASDTDNNNPTVVLMKKQINEIEREIIHKGQSDMNTRSKHSDISVKQENGIINNKDSLNMLSSTTPIDTFNSCAVKNITHFAEKETKESHIDNMAPAPHRSNSDAEPPNDEVEAAIKDIRLTLQRTKVLPVKPNVPEDCQENTISPVWVPRQRVLSGTSGDSDTKKPQSSEEQVDEEEADTDLETDRLLGQQRTDDQGFYDDKDKESKKKSRNKEGLHDPTVLIEGVLFRARYLGSTQLVCEGQPTKTTRMMQAEEAVSRIKAPDGETQPSTEVDLFISTEKIMVLNTDLKEIMMDHALRTISYIADIGDLVVLMARRRFVPHEMEDPPKINRTPKMICHVFESDEAQFIAQSIGQAFQVAYMEFLKANGIEDHSFVKEMDYQEVLNSQEIFGDELQMFAKKEMQKEVVVPKAKGEILGVVIVESGWGSMLPTVVIANLAPAGAAARCGQLNIGDQIIAINGVSLVGLPLSTCQNYIKNSKNQTVVKLTVVPCAPVVEVKIKRPDTKYQLGFSVQNGVICSLLRGGIAERGGVRVGHRIIEINNQSVVAVPHEKIVNLLATSVGEILMKTMPTSMFRLLTGQENPVYI